MNIEIKKAFNNIVFSEYLYICDEELERRNIYISEVKYEQDKLAQEFRLLYEERINRYLKNEDIKLCDEFYEALTESGVEFLAEINKSIVELTQAQSKIKSSVDIDLEMDVSLNTNTNENMIKILKIVSREKTIGNKETILNKIANTVHKNKKLELTLDEINLQVKEIFE